MEGLAAEGLRRHYDLVYRYVRRRTPGRVEAEDLTQEVFADAAAALERLASLSERQTLAWLYTVAKRRLVDEARRSTRRIDATDTHLELAPTPAVEYGPGVAWDLAHAVQELPDPQRVVVVMKLLEGRSFLEISRRIGTTEAAAKMRFARGLESVRASLLREGIEP